MSFINGLSDINNDIKLYKYEGKDLKPNNNYKAEPIDAKSDKIRISFLDVETTGLDKGEDSIIEIAIKCVELTKEDGNNLVVVDSYESFQDPGRPIPEEATEINGISDTMVKDQSIDWNKVKEIFEFSQLIVAHNASFDRYFVDEILEISKQKVWACSINDIDWSGRDFNSFKQEFLCIWHGFYYDAHRAMNDIDALIHLLVHPSYLEEKPIVELIKNARKPVCRVEATYAKFEYKDLLRKRNYVWYDPKTGNKNDKAWRKIISHDDIAIERKWLTENVYNNNFQGKVVEITIIDKYKD